MLKIYIINNNVKNKIKKWKFKNKFLQKIKIFKYHNPKYYK